MAGTMKQRVIRTEVVQSVSMESGLDGRNNRWGRCLSNVDPSVSMESGLDGRNNGGTLLHAAIGIRSQWSPA